MAITSFTSNNYLNRTTNLLDYNSTYTWMAWVYVTDSFSASFFGANAVAAGSLNYDYYGLISGNYQIITSRTTSETFSNPAFIGINQWFHFAAIRLSSTAVQCYQNGLTITSPASLNISARPANTVQSIGYFTSDAPLNPLLGRMFNIFEYNAALSQAEIQQQMYNHLPQRTNNLKGWFPAFSDSSRNVDFSGNRLDYTEVGVLANADGLLFPVSPLILQRSLSIAPPPLYFASPHMFMAY